MLRDQLFQEATEEIIKDGIIRFVKIYVEYLNLETGQERVDFLLVDTPQRWEAQQQFLEQTGLRFAQEHKAEIRCVGMYAEVWEAEQPPAYEKRMGGPRWEPADRTNRREGVLVQLCQFLTPSGLPANEVYVADILRERGTPTGLSPFRRSTSGLPFLDLFVRHLLWGLERYHQLPQPALTGR